jgi:two-component system, cell cycle sensor histidine kinase and response regulator CckA
MNEKSPRGAVCVRGRHDDHNYLRILLDANPSPCFLMDRNGIILAANEAIARRVGVPFAALAGTSVYDYMDAAVAEQRRAKATLAVETRQGFYFEDVHRGRVVASTVVPILNDHGAVEVLALFVSDVTDIRAAELARRESESRERARANELQTVMESVPAAVLIAHDICCQYVTCNRAASEMLRLTPGQIPSLTSIAGEKPDYRLFQNGSELPLKLLPLQLAASSGIPTPGTELQFLFGDGSTLDIFAAAAPLRDESGNLRGSVGAFIDISARKQVEQQLRASEARFREVFSQMATGVVVLGPHSGGRDFVHLDLNKAAGRCLRLPKEEIIGKTVLEIFPNLKGTGFVEAIRRVWDSGIPERWPESRYEDNRILIWFEAYFSKMPSGEIVAVFEDLTERKQLEAELLQLQKMEAIGRLAGGVAHDFNNQLTIIRGYCKLLRKEISPDSASARYLGEIMNAADRSTDITSQLLSFSRKQHLNAQPVHLNRVIAELKPALERMVGDNVVLHFQSAADPDVIEVDVVRLQNALFNLVANGRDAMPAGGSLWITTDSSPAGLPGEGDSALVCLTVADTGSGISEEIKHQIFDPFFTTKPVGKGTGLGLATVYGFVKQSNGNIEVNSVADGGTVFRISFPVSVKTVSLNPILSSAIPRNRGGVTILVVEDEPSVRQLLATLLKDHDFTVYEATDGKDALAIWQNNQIDLLITDIVMPRMGGLELVRHLRVLDPGLRVIFISGYSAGYLDRDAVPDGSAVLIKPFDPNDLLLTVSAVLNRAAAAGPI